MRSAIKVRETTTVSVGVALTRQVSSVPVVHEEGNRSQQHPWHTLALGGQAAIQNSVARCCLPRPNKSATRRALPGDGLRRFVLLLRFLGNSN